jgi:hypothetical protein
MPIWEGGMVTGPVRVFAERPLRVAAVAVFAVVAGLYASGLMLTLLASEPLWPTVAIVPLLGFPVVGMLVAMRRPDNMIAWLCLAIGLLWGMTASIDGALVHEQTFPGSIPRPDVLVALSALRVPGFFLGGEKRAAEQSERLVPGGLMIDTWAIPRRVWSSRQPSPGSPDRRPR